MLGHVGRVGHCAHDADGGPAGGIGGRREPDVRKRVRRGQPPQVDRRVEPLQQVLPQGRPLAHQLHHERVRQHEAGRAGDVPERRTLERHVGDDRRGPFVAVGHVRVERAHRCGLQTGAPAQRIDRVAAGGEQVAAPALARADPGPPAVPVGHPRQVLRAREADVAEPAGASQPARKSQEWVVSQLERHDRPHAGAPDGVANAHQLADVETGRLFEQQVLAGLGRRHGLVGVQMVRRRDGNDVHVRRREDVVVRGRDPRVRQRDSVLREVRAGAVRLARAQPGDGGVRVAQKRRDVLRRAPADAQDGHAQFSIRSGHFGAVA